MVKNNFFICAFYAHFVFYKKKKKKTKRKKRQLVELPVATAGRTGSKQQGATAQPPSHTLSQGNPKPQNPGVLRTQNEGEMTLSHIPHATARYHISRYLLLCREGALPSNIFIHTWYLRKNLHMPYTHSAFMFVPQTWIAKTLTFRSKTELKSKRNKLSSIHFTDGGSKD